MEIQCKPISQLYPADYNPRKDSKVLHDKLKASLMEFGYLEPIIWNKRNGRVIGGHKRLEALRELGYQEVEVVVADLPEAKEKVLNLALNRIVGEWDEERLARLLDELSHVPALDVTLTGFDLPEISELLDHYQEPREDDFDIEAAVGAIETPITQPGDVIQLGPHRLLCGDAANPEHLQRLLADVLIDLLHCDFPYNVNYMGGSRPNPHTRPKKSRQWDRIYADDMPQAEYEAWMRQVFTALKPHLKLGGAIYVWQGHRQFPPMYEVLLELGFHIGCVICWMKESAAITYADYSFQTEQCLYGWLTGATHYWAGPPLESNLWPVKRDPTKSYIHPTQKPIALAQRAIRNSSQRDEAVLDVFLGSGSTLMAAESLGRRCYGLEIDPKYCDAIVRRYIAFVGKDKVSEDIRARYLKEASHAG